MPYGWLPIVIVFSLVFSANSFSLEPVGENPIAYKLAEKKVSELAPEVALVEGLNASPISNSSNNDVSDAASDMLLEQLQIELSDEDIQTGQFESLESAIDFYRFLHESGQWSPISEGSLLKLGDAHPQVVELRKLLQLYGDFDLGTEILEPVELFDLQLHHALQSFQQRHGAKADGVLGPKTRRLLNVSPQQRVDQIALNIYRQRQLGLENIGWPNTALDAAESESTMQENSSRYLQVNIP